MARQTTQFEKKYHKRIIILILLVILMFVLASMRAFEFQIIEGEEHVNAAKKDTNTTITVMANRGEIVDKHGVPFTHNEVVFNIVIDYSFVKPSMLNDTIVNLLRLMERTNEEWIDELPITKTKPYEFIEGRERDVTRLKEKIGVLPYATADNCMENMYKDFKIKKYENDKGDCTHCGEDFDECTYTEYDEEMSADILSVRYQMLNKDFSAFNRYVFAEDIKPTSVAIFKEFSSDFRGAFIDERSKRTYVGGDVASHVVGTIGPIYQEEAIKYIGNDNSDYLLTDLVGKSGIEKTAEADLKGKNGKVKVFFDSQGNVVDTIESVVPIAGKTVQLTLDYEFQKELQQILADYIKEFNETNDDDKYVDSASIVVLDVKTGGVLALVSYPYYDINDYMNNYSEVLNREGKPLNNKALQGLYRPGSTFKPTVAAAGILDGLVEPDTEIICTGTYDYWDDISFGCLNDGHRVGEGINVSSALHHSCNIYFYDIGRRLSIETMNDYAENFGFGVDTGLELPNAKGNLSSREFSKSHGIRWEEGNVVQAAIGQQDTAVTPLQMAIQAMTLANKGTRYDAHIIKGLLTNDSSKVLSEKETVIASEMDMTDEEYNAIANGMVAASQRLRFPNQLNDLGYQVAVKTGTPQVTKTKTNSAFIAFSPTESPEIAISCIVEDGDNSIVLLRRILKAYERSQGIYTDPLPVEPIDGESSSQPIEGENSSQPIEGESSSQPIEGEE